MKRLGVECSDFGVIGDGVMFVIETWCDGGFGAGRSFAVESLPFAFISRLEAWFFEPFGRPRWLGDTWAAEENSRLEDLNLVDREITRFSTL